MASSQSGIPTKKQNYCLWIIFGLLGAGALILLLISFLGSDSTPPVSDQKDPNPWNTLDLEIKNPHLFYLKKSKKTCLWHLYDLNRSTKLTIHESSECPIQLLWSKQEKQLNYLQRDGLYTLTWEKGKNIEKLVSLPNKVLPSESSMKLWIDRESGRLRMAILVSPEQSKENPEKQLQTYFYQGQAYTITKDPHGWFKYYVKDGKVFPTDPGQGQEVSLPPWGMPKLAILFELSQGQWKTKIMLPTLWEAGDTPGLDVLDPWIQKSPDYFSLAELISSCGLPDCFWKNPDCVQQSKTLKELMNTNKQVEEIRYISLNHQVGWFYGVLWGDSPHNKAPIVYGTRQCQELKALKSLNFDDSYQLSVAPEAKMLLIKDNESPSTARIYQSGAAEPLLELSRAQSIIWFPTSLLSLMHGSLP